MSSDILGIELGRRVVRGVRLDQYRAELTAVAECELFREGLSAEGIVDVAVFGPVLEDLLARLKVTDRSRVRIGFAVGPRNSGVGSGPAMAGWLEQQAKNLQENMQCSGGLGVAFVPTRAVDAAVKLSRDGGIDLARLDLAPVAAARAIGAQVDDRICLGSGHGWQARMRDLEVLEAKENLHVGFDDPMTLVNPKGEPRSIERYGWVEMSQGLEQAGGLNMAQMAVAVGVAIGVAYNSPADLLQSRLVPGESDETGVDPALAHLAGYELSPESATEATIRLQAPAKPELPKHSAARRAALKAPGESSASVRRPTAPNADEDLLVIEPAADSGSAQELPRVEADIIATDEDLVLELEQLQEEAAAVAAESANAGAAADAADVAGPADESAAAEDLVRGDEPGLEPELAYQMALQAELQRQSKPGFEAEYQRQMEADTSPVAVDTSDRSEPDAESAEMASVESDQDDDHQSILIDMFSPETDARHILGRERRLVIDVAIVLLAVLAIGVALYVFAL
ncbi:MAG: hypothetical protein AAF531_24105 [Actinomycetota bacterium]